MNVKKWIAPAIGVVLLLIFVTIPPVAPLTPIGMKAIGVFLFTVVWWATVSTGYPSLIAIALLAIFGVMTPKDAFANSFGHWFVLFILGTNGMSEALRGTGYSRRFALWFISRPFVAGHPWRLVMMFLLAVTSVGAILTGAATTVIFMAIAVPMLEAMGYKKGDTFAATLMMGVAWAATTSLSMTPIGHAGNILAIEWIKRDYGYSISFLHWMAYGIPMGLLTLGILLLIFRYWVRPDVKRIADLSGPYIREEIAKLGPMKREEKISLAVFLVAVIIWVFPSTVGGIMPKVATYFDKLGYAVPAVIGACLLCIIEVKGKPILSFRQWMTEGVEWDTIALVAGIGIISFVLENPKTGITDFLAGVCRPIAQALPVYGFIAFALLWVVIQTNAMSNLVSFVTVYTILIPVAISLKIGYGPAITMVLACASNYAYSLPSATPATALVTGSGWVPVPFMFKYGLPLVIPIVVLFTFFGYPLAMLIFR